MQSQEVIKHVRFAFLQRNCSEKALQIKKTKTWKRSLGEWLFPRLPLSPHVLSHVRLEVNGSLVRLLHRIHPVYRKKLRDLSKQRNLLANIGCGPFGQSAWVNLDLYPHQNLTLRADCRRTIPLADKSCAGIHVEHFLEHLEPIDERPQFLNECRRCLEPTGVLRVIVPDAELYLRAYRSAGWDALNSIGCGGDVPEQVFRTKMEALNHVFLQGWEHYGGYDAETLKLVLIDAGFGEVNQRTWGEGDFPQGCIDREQHRPYSLYFEARR